MSDVFSDQLPNDVTVDTLVGEGKKYSDINALATAYVNSDSFIEQLKRDNAQLRAEKDANQITPNADGNLEQQNQAPTPPNPAETPKPQTKDVDLRKLVSEEIQNLDQSRRFENNVQEAANKMAEIYGSTQKAQEAVVQKARELGVSAEWLRDAAARSPQAFYATMGVNPGTPPQNRETPAPHSDVKLNTNLNANTKNYAYFEDMRKTNKSQYYSANVQAEMQRLARDKGDAFYT